MVLRHTLTTYRVVRILVHTISPPSPEELIILPLPRLYTTVRQRTRPVAVAAAIPSLSLVPLDMGIAEHSLPMEMAVLIHLIHLPRVPVTTTIHSP